MPFLPIAERELRVAARRRSTYRIRFWAVLAGSIVFGWRCLDLLQQQTSSARQGHELFLTVVILGFVFALLAGAYTTSDCLSIEKRDGTMGLLFLTDLKGYDIVIGKLVASSLSAAYGLVAIIPMIAVPILMGGVTIPDFLRAVVALGSTLFLSLAAGMVASTYNRNERTATFYTVLILLILVFAPFLFVFVLSTYFSIRDEAELVQFAMMSPAFLLAPIVESRATVVTNAFWSSVGMIWGCTVFFLAWVSVKLPKSWQDKPTRKAFVEKRVAHIARNNERRKRLRRLLDVNPFLWISFRSGKKTSHTWMFLTSMIIIWLLGYASWRSDMFDLGINGTLLIILNGFFKIWVVTEACQQLIEARRSGALELLLSTPLTDQNIIRGQWLALRRQFALPLLILGTLELFVVYKGGKLTFFFFTITLSLLVDFVAMGWAGMWLGLTAKNTTRAISKAVVLIMALPWAVFYVSSLAFEFLQNHVIGTFSSDVLRLLMVVYWAGLSLVAAYLVGFQWARRKLLKNFRQIATEQFHAKNKED